MHECDFLFRAVCYENAVSRMISTASVEDAEVSTINSLHRPLAATRSDASVQSQITLSPTGELSLMKGTLVQSLVCAEGFVVFENLYSG